MPVTIIEKPESRVYNLQQPGNENTIGCTYQVRWTPATDTEAYPGDPTILTNANVPKPSLRPPAALHATDAWMKLAVCRSVSYAPDRAAPYTWIVQATYGVVQEPYAAMGYFCRQTRNASSRTLAQYRTWTALPTNGDAAWPPSSDIGGTRVDLNGQPRRREIAGQTIQLEYLWDRTTAGSTVQHLYHESGHPELGGDVRLLSRRLPALPGMHSHTGAGDMAADPCLDVR
jgi:hypothetical protein